MFELLTPAQRERLCVAHQAVDELLTDRPGKDYPEYRKYLLEVVLNDEGLMSFAWEIDKIYWMTT